MKDIQSNLMMVCALCVGIQKRIRYDRTHKTSPLLLLHIRCACGRGDGDMMDITVKRDLQWDRNRPLLLRFRRRAFIIFTTVVCGIMDIIMYDKVYEYKHLGRKPRPDEM